MLPNALLCKTNAEKWFKGVWSSECKENRKLRYYSHTKKDIGLEPYVAHCCIQDTLSLRALGLAAA